MDPLRSGSLFRAGTGTGTGSKPVPARKPAATEKYATLGVLARIAARPRVALQPRDANIAAARAAEPQPRPNPKPPPASPTPPPAPVQAEISDYERARNDRIRANQEELRKLGLLPAAQALQDAINTSAASKVSGIRLRVWWPERQGRRVVVGGLREDSGQPWRTSAIETRHTACVVSTFSGTVYELVGPADQDRARHYGCPQATAALFSDGFPPSWSSSSTWEEEEEEEDEREGGEWEVDSDSEYEYSTSSRALQCPLCGRGDFKNRRGFKIHASRCKNEHIQRQLGTARTECQYCGRDDFETAHGLKIHEGSCKKRCHDPGDKYKPARRSARQAEQSSSDDGQEEEEEEEEEEDVADEESHGGSRDGDNDDDDEPPPCQYCGKSGFKNTHGLHVHEGRCKNAVPRAKGKKFVCSECGSSLRTKTGLKIHRTRMHGLKTTEFVETDSESGDGDSWSDESDTSDQSDDAHGEFEDLSDPDDSGSRARSPRHPVQRRAPATLGMERVQVMQLKPSTSSGTSAAHRGLATAGGAWSPDELRLLQSVVLAVDPKDPKLWERVAASLPGRSKEECAAMYFHRSTSSAAASSSVAHPGKDDDEDDANMKRKFRAGLNVANKDTAKFRKLVRQVIAQEARDTEPHDVLSVITPHRSLVHVGGKRDMLAVKTPAAAPSPRKNPLRRELERVDVDASSSSAAASSLSAGAVGGSNGVAGHEEQEGLLSPEILRTCRPGRARHVHCECTAQAVAARQGQEQRQEPSSHRVAQNIRKRSQEQFTQAHPGKTRVHGARHWQRAGHCDAGWQCTSRSQAAGKALR